MNLSHLRFASAVAAHGSFSAAAAQCCVTQPTLSNGVAQLERELGARLFERTTRKVGLTPFGQHVLPHLNEVLAAQAGLVQQARSFLAPARRLVRIGMSPLVSAHLLGLLVDPFRAQNPGVDVVLREMNMADLHRLLDGGLLDVVVGVAGERKDAWAGAFLYEEALLYIPRGGAWPKGPPPEVDFKDIADETFLMVPDACGLARATRALFRARRRKLREYAGQAMGYHVLAQWAALGIGAAILPASKVAAQEGRAAVPVAVKPGRHAMLGFEACWLRASPLPTHLRAFAEHLGRVVPGIVEGLDPGAGPRG